MNYLQEMREREELSGFVIKEDFTQEDINADFERKGLEVQQLKQGIQKDMTDIMNYVHILVKNFEHYKKSNKVPDSLINQLAYLKKNLGELCAPYRHFPKHDEYDPAKVQHFSA
jgi:hypothetical protein